MNLFLLLRIIIMIWKKSGNSNHESFIFGKIRICDLNHVFSNVFGFVSSFPLPQWIRDLVPFFVDFCPLLLCKKYILTFEQFQLSLLSPCAFPLAL